MVYDIMGICQLKLKRLFMAKLVTKIQISNLFSAIAEHREDDMVSMLTENISLLDACNESGWSAIHRCAKHGTKAMMHKLVVDFKADVNAVTEGDYTPAQIAAEYSNFACLLELVSNGADTSLYNLSHKDPLDFLADNHNELVLFNKDGNFLTHQDDHLAVQIGDHGPLVSLHDFLHC